MKEIPELASTLIKPPNKFELEAILDLKLLIGKNEGLVGFGVHEDEEFLVAFLRGKDLDVEKAYKTLASYIQIRKEKYRKFFKSLSPRNFKYLIDRSIKIEDKFNGLLKYPDAKGRAISLTRCSLFNPRLHKGDDVLEAWVIAGTELLRTECATRNGLVVVVDGAGFGLKHAREFSMSRIYMFMNIFLGAYPVKYKGFHIMNNAYIFNTLLALAKTLAPKKLIERIHLHGNNYDSLHAHIPRNILPKSFGGDLDEEEAFDFEFEDRILRRTEYYEKIAGNWS